MSWRLQLCKNKRVEKKNDGNDGKHCGKRRKECACVRMCLQNEGKRERERMQEE